MAITSEYRNKQKRKQRIYIMIGDKLHAKKVCQGTACFPAWVKITFAPYGRALSPGRKMAGAQLFRSEDNWIDKLGTMFSDIF